MRWPRTLQWLAGYLDRCRREVGYVPAPRDLEEGRHVFGRPEMQKALASRRASNGGLHRCLSGGESITSPHHRSMPCLARADTARHKRGLCRIGSRGAGNRRVQRRLSCGSQVSILRRCGICILLDTTKAFGLTSAIQNEAPAFLQGFVLYGVSTKIVKNEFRLRLCHFLKNVVCPQFC